MKRLAGWIAFGACALCLSLWAIDRLVGEDIWWDVPAKVICVSGSVYAICVRLGIGNLLSSRGSTGRFIIA